MASIIAALVLLAGILPGPTHTAPSPRLVVLLTVDQLRPDYLDRYRDQWTGGFRRLLDQAAYFPNGQQDHAMTLTAPGHASVLSGRFPGHTGIPTNALGVEDSTAPLLTGSGSGASPRRFRGTALYDWIIARDSAARVLSVSRKDRSAILPVGRARGQVYWYNGGSFTTSRYYMNSLPAWVTGFNVRRGGQQLAGSRWNQLLDDASYPEPDSMPFEHGGHDYGFPHRFPSTPDSSALELPSFPWMDSLTLAFALEGVTGTQLGRRAGTDLLCIGLSATDAVGHDFGPDSRELHDHLLRLDRWLGQFIDSLGAMVPAGEIVFVLASDHGVQSFPELGAAKGTRSGGRVWMSDLARDASRQLFQRYQTDFRFRFEDGLLMADVAALRARGVDVDSLADALAASARARPGVIKVFTPATLARADSRDREARLWRHTLTPDLTWLFAAVVAPGYLWDGGSGSTTHGSTNLLDTTIPIAFWGPGIRPGRFARQVNSVDIGPTLAALIGVTPTEPVDGHVLNEVVAPGHTH